MNIIKSRLSEIIREELDIAIEKIIISRVQEKLGRLRSEPDTSKKLQVTEKVIKNTSVEISKYIKLKGLNESFVNSLSDRILKDRIGE